MNSKFSEHIEDRLKNWKEEDLVGYCSICGHFGFWQRGDGKSFRESYQCEKCHCALRWRDQASLIVDNFSDGRISNLEAMVELGYMDGLDIYEIANRGPFVKRLNKLERYTQSYFQENMESGEINELGIRNEDIQNLSFDDKSFDLIISSDVMEHVEDYKRAFKEILRVLKDDGVYIFTIPIGYPFPEKTETRARRIEGRIENFKDKRYHIGGDGSKCLVYTDFGADLKNIVEKMGGKLNAVRRNLMHPATIINITYTMRKASLYY
uniref:class I SAM-dependent methyltransferase n=1 Tax=Synechococcus sp. UW106 TaxID=368495 RepID=UPI000E0F67DA|nr:class I SAM-dependent methyltransferase [Synechococcus sp. UW106]